MNNWSYDPTNAIGKLASRSTSGFSETYSYDALARLSSVQTSISYPHGTVNFTLSQSYDNYSRPYQTTFPSGFVKRNYYNTYGYGYQVENSSSIILHKITAVSPFGQPTTETFGSGGTRTTGYDLNSGRVTSIAQTNLNTLSYVWRADGVLTQRSIGSTTEAFSYDSQRRLTQASVSGMRTLSYSYDHLGNLLHLNSSVGGDKDANSMSYGLSGAGPNALSQGAYGGVLNTFGYDAVGNVTAIGASSGNASFVYDAQNRATSISKGGVTEQFKYDPDGARFYKYSSDGPKYTFYLYGGMYQETRVGTETVGTRVTEVTDSVREIKDSSGNESYLYLRRDHLGSVEAIQNAYTGLVAEFGYDPFGSRRASNWSADISSSDLNAILSNEDTWTKRGFTDHEHLDRVDVVHMNGRIYDPRFGRFLNADPLVSNPTRSQSFNRYSYVVNNPLSYTDPTGYEVEVVKVVEHSKDSDNNVDPGDITMFFSGPRERRGGGNRSDRNNPMREIIVQHKRSTETVGKETFTIDEFIGELERYRGQIIGGERIVARHAQEGGGSGVSGVVASSSIALGLLSEYGSYAEGTWGITSKGVLRFYSNSWGGNQYIATYATNAVKWAKFAGVAGFAVDLTDNVTSVLDRPTPASFRKAGLNMSLATAVLLDGGLWPVGVANTITEHYDGDITGGIISFLLRVGPQPVFPGPNYGLRR